MSNSSIRSLFYSATKTVAASATPEVLSVTPLLVDSLRVDPLPTNTGTASISFENSLVTSPIFFSLPFTLTATEGKKIDLSQVTVKVTVNGEGVSFIGLN